MALLPVCVVVVAVIAALLKASVRMVQEYERGVVFRLGRLKGAKGPGVFLVAPVLDRFVKINLQTDAVAIQRQAAITKDNVTLQVDAVAYMTVFDAVKAVVEVKDWKSAAHLAAQASLRTIIGAHDLDDLLTSRETITEQLRDALDARTEGWGVRVDAVHLRDVTLPAELQRAMGRQAEAERDKRAKIIDAEGELMAAEKLSAAAEMMSGAAGAMQLRTLQTLSEVATEKNSTIVLPIPTELFSGIAALAGSAKNS